MWLAKDFTLLILALLASPESVGSTERRLAANADADPQRRHDGRQDIALNLNEPFVLRSLGMLMDLFR